MAVLLVIVQIWAIKPFSKSLFKCILVLGFMLVSLVPVRGEKSVSENSVSSACAVFTVI